MREKSNPADMPVFYNYLVVVSLFCFVPCFGFFLVGCLVAEDSGISDGQHLHRCVGCMGEGLFARTVEQAHPCLLVEWPCINGVHACCPPSK